MVSRGSRRPKEGGTVIPFPGQEAEVWRVEARPVTQLMGALDLSSVPSGSRTEGPFCAGGGASVREALPLTQHPRLRPRLPTFLIPRQAQLQSHHCPERGAKSWTQAAARLPECSGLQSCSGRDWPPDLHLRTELTPPLGGHPLQPQMEGASKDPYRHRHPSWRRAGGAVPGGRVVAQTVAAWEGRAWEAGGQSCAAEPQEG